MVILRRGAFDESTPQECKERLIGIIIGCVERMKCEEQEEHNEQSMNEHLQMAVEEIA